VSVYLSEEERNVNTNLDRVAYGWRIPISLPPKQPFDNTMQIKVPREIRALRLATKLHPVGSKVKGNVFLFQPGENPSTDLGDYRWAVGNDQEYMEQTLVFHKPGTYTLAFRGDVRDIMESTTLFTGENRDRRYAGLIEFLCLEWIPHDSEGIPAQSGDAYGASITVSPEVEPLGPGQQPGPVPTPGPQPAPQPGPQRSDVPDATQVVYMPVPAPQPAEVTIVQQAAPRKKRGFLGKLGCALIVVAAALILFGFLGLVFMGPTLGEILQGMGF
jgi:hypothetical protein